MFCFWLLRCLLLKCIYGDLRMTPIASSIHNQSKTDGLMNCGGTMQSQQMTCEEALGARYLKDV